jgi:hypothetical protein
MYFLMVKIWIAGVFLPLFSLRRAGSFISVMIRMYLLLDSWAWDFWAVGYVLSGLYSYYFLSPLSLYELLNSYLLEIINIMKSDSAIFNINWKVVYIDNFFQFWYYPAEYKKTFILAFWQLVQLLLALFDDLWPGEIFQSMKVYSSRNCKCIYQQNSKVTSVWKIRLYTWWFFNDLTSLVKGHFSNNFLKFISRQTQ